MQPMPLSLPLEPPMPTDERPYTDFLQRYPYPAFLLSATIELGKSAPSLCPVWCNPSLSALLTGSHSDLLSTRSSTERVTTAFLGSLHHTDVHPFGEWTISQDHDHNLTLRPRWMPTELPDIQLQVTKTRIDDFWVCTTVPQSPLPIIPSTPTTLARRRAREADLSLALKPTLHHPLKLSRLGDSQMAAMIDSFDWSNTPLGPREKWPQSLITSLGICMSSQVPGAVWWGREAVIIYNDAYIPTAGAKHPQIFGQSGSAAWSELWEDIGPSVQSVFDGASVFKKDDLLLSEKLTDARLPEENYSDWSYRPISQEDGTIGGFLNDCFDTTQKVLAQRRMSCLRDLTGATSLATSVPEFTDAIIRVLSDESYARDVPFAALYFYEPSSSTATTSSKSPFSEVLRTPTRDCTSSSIQFNLAGTVGIPADHPAAPKSTTCNVTFDGHNIDSLNSLRLPGLVDPQSLDMNPVAAFSQQDHDQPVDYLSAKKPSSIPVSTGGSASRMGSDGSGGTGTLQAPRSIADSPSSKGSSVGSVSQQTCPWPFAEALRTHSIAHVNHLPDLITDGLEKRGWADKAREAVILPISLSLNQSSLRKDSQSVNAGRDSHRVGEANVSAGMPCAVLVLGLNTRRPYDAEYQRFVEIMRLSLCSTMAAMLGREADLVRADHYASLDAAKTVFFSNVSHELRTPLTLIGAPLEDSIAELSDGRIKSNLKLASRNVRRLSRLVDSLMDFSMLAANKLEGHFQSVPLGVFTADLAALFRSTVEKSGMQYNVECDMDLSQPLCYIDPDFWEKIVFNLIGNAFKYTFSGSITVHVEHTATHAVFVVEDTGIGISQSDQLRIFERFHRVPSVSRSHEGTGIGLSMTKELVNLHGGELMVESVTGETEHGSKFTVRLLLGKDHLPPTNTFETDLESISFKKGSYARDIVEEAKMWSRTATITSGADGSTPSTDSEATEESRSSEGTASTGPGRFDISSLAFSKKDVVLIVDDNFDMRRFIKSILSPYCTVFDAANGAEALEVIKSTKPNLILSDVMMPVIDGFALIDSLRADKATALIPIILITAKAGNEETAEGLLSGADDYITKPFKSTELVARAHLQMNLGKSRIELEARFQERTRELAQLLDLNPVAIVRSTQDGYIVFVNPRWYEMTGRERGSPLDEWPESVRQDDLPQVLEFWRRAHLSPSDEESEDGLMIDFRWSNGKWCQMQVVRAEGGGTMCSLTDITHQRMYESQKLAHLQEREALARKRAEEADQRRKEAEERRRGQELLIDVTSHELRQPVSAILNCSSLVRSNITILRDSLAAALSQETLFSPTGALLATIADDLEALDSIYQCGLTQERIANDVLSLSRLQLNVLSIHPSPFELVSEVRRICSIFRNEVKMKKLNLSVEFGDSLNTLGVSHILCDKSRLGQVITNLLSNAIKFTDTSTDLRDIKVHVDVAMQEPSDNSCRAPELSSYDTDYRIPPGTPLYIYTSVTDSGPGLSPEDLELLFNRFQQGSNSHDIFGGSGLGLFVSRSLCDLMGGKIQVESEHGRGATFRFFIQCTSVLAPSSTSSPSTRSLTLATGSGTSLSSSDNLSSPQLHVLITEDNIINQTVLNRQLKSAGCTTTLANNGLQAIEQITKLANSTEGPRQFDAILLDVEMPVMDGLTAVRQIRTMETSGELPGKHNRIFALTGNAREGQVDNIRNAGMDAVLIKPYKIDDVMNHIRYHRTPTS